MFSFFKKSKKEGDASSARENKDKKSKERELKADQCAAIPVPRVTKDMCKNKCGQKCENMSAGGAHVVAENGPKDIAFLPLTSDNLVIDNERKTNETIQKQESAQKTTQPNLQPNPENSNANSSESMFSFFVKRSPDSGQPHNVKPCGHGTVAISPRIPPQTIETPPDSPKLDFRRRKSKEISEESTNETHSDPLRDQSKEIKLEELDKRKNGDVPAKEQFFDANFDEDDV